MVEVGGGLTGPSCRVRLIRLRASCPETSGLAGGQPRLESLQGTCKGLSVWSRARASDEGTRPMIEMSVRRGLPRPELPVRPAPEVRAGTTRRRGVLLVATGSLAGVLAGLLGVAGGVVMVPALTTRRLGLDRASASGTTIAAALPILAVGMLAYGHGHNVDFGAAAWIIPTAVVGVAFGSRLAPRLPTATMRRAFLVLLVVTALRMLIALPSHASQRVGGGAGSFVALGVVGLCSGVISGILGSGGGTIIVPAMVVLFGLAQPVAQGTALLAVLPVCVIGSAVHGRQGTLRAKYALTMGAAGAATVVPGAVLASHIAADPLRIGFAAYLLLIVALGSAKTLHRRPAERRSPFRSARGDA